MSERHKEGIYETIRIPADSGFDTDIWDISDPSAPKLQPNK